MPQSSQNRVLIVGASSGIGKALAEEYLKAGAHVAMVARRRDRMEEIAKQASGNPQAKALIYEHDVRNYAGTEELFQRITNDLQGLDVIIYSSGVMFNTEEHEYSFEKDREVLEVNTVAAFAWLNEAAKRFERVKSGTIVGISSVAGERGRRGNPAYCTSKAAFTTYLESLRNRASRYGVKVITIKPGFIDTDMTRGKPGLIWLISAEEAAKRIINIIKSGKEDAFVPGKWRFVALVLKSIPSFIFRKLSI
jgi:short-subunit dehydrogenase